MAGVTIPFNRPGLAGNEWRYLSEALEAMHISGDGAFTKRCQALLENELGAARVLLTTSCTAALEMTALLLNLREGDEIIVPSFAFVSTVNAYILRGAVPVFCDIRPDTLNLDERKIEDLITPRSKAIVVVHYAGIGAEMEHILRIADSAGIPVIEDNAHGLFGKRDGKYLGSFGPLATQSFHETKNFSVAREARSLSTKLRLLIGQKSFGKRARIESGFSKVLWTSIHGSMWDRASFLQICLPRSSMRNWKLGILFKRNEGPSGIAIMMN